MARSARADRVFRGCSARAAPGQGELEHDAARFVRFRPQPAAMVGDDGPADRQAHAHSAALRGIESIKNARDMVRIDAWSRIAHCHEEAIGLNLRSADQQFSCPSFNQCLLSAARDNSRLCARWLRRARRSVYHFSSALGSVNRNAAPQGALASAQSRPPWASMMERQIDKPIPVPLVFVV